VIWKKSEETVIQKKTAAPRDLENSDETAVRKKQRRHRDRRRR
jgi:hypothetical protein